MSVRALDGGDVKRKREAFGRSVCFFLFESGQTGATSRKRRFLLLGLDQIAKTHSVEPIHARISTRSRFFSLVGDWRSTEMTAGCTRSCGAVRKAASAAQSCQTNIYTELLYCILYVTRAYVLRSTNGAERWRAAFSRPRRDLCASRCRRCFCG